MYRVLAPAQVGFPALGILIVWGRRRYSLFLHITHVRVLSDLYYVTWKTSKLRSVAHQTAQKQ